MSRMLWGAAGSRLFEAGVDRGVLYPPAYPYIGVPWSGLISVNEAPTGGDAQPYYLDGIKYLQVAAAEEYNATIEAFSAPVEFNVCDGTQRIYGGLFVTQQPRQQFGFTYRTLIGNDLDAENHGYKIHIVYNALAKPSTRPNASISDSADPLNLSWDISTVPPAMDGVRPTAHMVIDSTLSTAGALAAAEDALYGSDDNDPYLPTPTELAAIFVSNGVS